MNGFMLQFTVMLQMRTKDYSNRDSGDLDGRKMNYIQKTTYHNQSLKQKTKTTSTEPVENRKYMSRTE